LSLPANLTPASLQAFWKGAKASTTKARTAVVLWQPHGADKVVDAAQDVAVVWSDVGDAAELSKWFTGANAMTTATVCGHFVLASTSSMMRRVKATCAGTSPNITFAAPAVVAGLAEPLSVFLTVDIGRALAGITGDAAAADAKKVPTEIEAAQQQLKKLPRIGVVGTKDNTVLVPRGFSS
jgi:hypothetical protein